MRKDLPLGKHQQTLVLCLSKHCFLTPSLAPASPVQSLDHSAKVNPTSTACHLRRKKRLTVCPAAKAWVSCKCMIFSCVRLSTQCLFLRPVNVSGLRVTSSISCSPNPALASRRSFHLAPASEQRGKDARIVS
jgi:hypothetical protein